MLDATQIGGDQGATSPEKAKFVASAASQAYKGPSIYDYTALSGNNNAYASQGDREYRANLATEYGIQDYNTGTNTASKNTELLNALRSGSPVGAGTGSQLGGGGTGAGPGAGDGTGPGAGDGTGDGTTGARSPADQAFDSYLQSLSPSSASTDAQKYLDDLQTKAELGRERGLNSGDTLGYAAGEAQRIGRNFDIKIGGQARVVQAQAALDANRQNISKARYEYEQKKIDDAAKGQEGFSLSDGQERYEYNSETRSYDKVAGNEKYRDPNDAAYKAAQIRNINSQIADRESKGEDDDRYTIKDRNSLMGFGFEPSEVDDLQDMIRKYGFRAVLESQTDQNVIDALEMILDSQGKLGS